MQRINFNQGWTFSRSGSDQSQSVNIPHDAMIHEQRDAAAAGGSAHAFFPGGLYRYEKSFHVPAEWEKMNVIFEFEGVYRNCNVLINGREAGGQIGRASCRERVLL